MPNWYNCTYKYIGDLKGVRLLYKVPKCIGKHKTLIIRSGSGKWWLGNLVVEFDGDWEKYRYRGEITYYELNGNILTIYQNTTWCEQEGVRKIVEEKFSSIKVYYHEEEPGCGVYYTNDANGEYFPERYYLDSYVDDSKCSTTIEEVADRVSGIIGEKVEPDKNAVEETSDEYTERLDDGDVWYSFHESTVVDE